MNSYTSQSDVELSHYDFYPPLKYSGSASVTFSATSPGGAPLTFDFTLNGSVAEVPGITLHAGIAGGVLTFTRDFINAYAGPWPALLTLRAWLDGQEAGSASLRLHDTRSMLVQRVEGTLVPSQQRVPQSSSSVVQVRAVFFDAADVQLPVEEVSWLVALDGVVPGVVVEGYGIRVYPQAQVGEIAVRVRELSGVEQDLVLTLLPIRDLQVETSPEHIYPPLISGANKIVRILTADTIDGDINFSLTLNGKSGHHIGIDARKISGEWSVLMDKTFIANFVGSWPVEAKLEASQGNDIIGSATFWLHDTRTMVCTEVDLEFHPGSKVKIPAADSTQVVAAPRLYDEMGVLLPHDELEWEAQIVDPMEGVTQIGHILGIGPEAKPGRYRVGIEGPNGLRRARVLTLY